MWEFVIKNDNDLWNWSLIVGNGSHWSGKLNLCNTQLSVSYDVIKRGIFEKCWEGKEELEAR